MSVVLRAHLGARFDPSMAAGWDGDRILLYGAREGPPVLLRYTTGDREADAREFLAAAREMFRVRRPGARLREVPGKDFLLQVEEGGKRAHALERRGRDVLLAEGLPRPGYAGILARAFTAEAEEKVLRRRRFGTRK